MDGAVQPVAMPPVDKEEAKRLFKKGMIDYALSDPSLLSLLVSNVLMIATALAMRWEVFTVLMVYLAQSVIIGIFAVLKMLSLKEFSTDGLKMGGKPVDPTPSTKRQVALSFVIFYGLFHLLYAFFVWKITSLSGAERAAALSDVALGAGYFFLHHLYSFVRHRAEREGRPNIGNMMFFPFIRILPMHLTIIFGGMILMVTGWNVLVLLLFLILRALADLLSHLIEHHKEILRAMPERLGIRELDSAGREIA